jgi:ABC-2 type transport system ATP-binding protein
VQITEVRDLIKELGKNHTIILSTHLLPEVSMVCNRVIIINRGKLVALDTPINLAEGVGDKAVIEVEVLGLPADVAKTLRTVSGVKSAMVSLPDGTTRDGVLDGVDAGAYTYKIENNPQKDVRPGIANALVGGGFSLLELRTVRPTLEEIFIDVISKEQDEEDYEDADGYPDEYDDSGDEYDEEEPEVAPPPAKETVASRRRVRR